MNIKFRFWDCKIKKYRYGDICLSSNGKPFVIYSDGKTEFLNDIIIEQFTGLKDKNGKDIYEGDIVRLDDSNRGFSQRQNSPVEIYRAYSGAYVFKDTCHDTNLRNCERFLCDCDFEVVGNIHQNKEFINE